MIQQFIQLPSTLSHKILTDLLKGEMGFNGVVVTDAMNMAGIAATYDEVQAVKLAINAGVDLICMPTNITCLEDMSKLDAIIDGVEKAVNDGEIQESRLDDAVTRVLTLKENKGIIRNQRKISAAVSNATIFMKIQEEYGTFSEYLWKFTDHKIIHETGKTSSELSDQVSKDLKKRGMKFVGTTIIYSYLQAVGVVESHEEGCFLHHKE